MYRKIPDGHLTVVHHKGNKHAYCIFENSYSESEKRGYYVHIHVIEYTGDKAIQHVLERVGSIPDNVFTDAIFGRLNFYNRAYVDYIASIDKEEPDYSHYRCDGHCVNLTGEDTPFTCNHHPSVHYYHCYCLTIGDIQERFENRCAEVTE